MFDEVDVRLSVMLRKAKDSHGRRLEFWVYGARRIGRRLVGVAACTGRTAGA